MILIVNADDFGLSEGVNRGVIDAHRFGIVTSASLMVRGKAAPDAAKMARENPSLSVGLHVDLGESIYEAGQWRRRYSVVPTDHRPAVASEIARQVDLFREMVGSEPTHLDSHQHIHREEPLLSLMRTQALKLSVPLRFHSPVRYCGNFYGQSSRGEPSHENIRASSLCRLLACLSAPVSELVCHPASTADAESTYREERVIEFRTLCDPAVAAELARIGLSLQSFAGINCF